MSDSTNGGGLLIRGGDYSRFIKGRAVETGCSGLHYMLGCCII